MELHAHPDPSRRIAAVQSPIIPVVGAWTRDNPGTLSLGQGMVSYPPPDSALDAIRDFGRQAEQHLYGSAFGYSPLLDLLRDKLRRENGIDTDTGTGVMITAGSNMAFLNVLLAIADPGDEIILPLPYYFNQEMAIRMLGCLPVGVPTDSAYQLDVTGLRAAINEKTRAIVTISPNNPSGAVYPEAALRAVNALCRAYGLYHISDEAYEYFTYGEARHFSPGSLPGAAPHTISLYSLSKAYGFASWRIGYMAYPEALTPSLLKIQDTNLICPPLVNQIAAAGALRTGADYCKNRLPELAAKREQVIARLQPLKGLCEIPEPEGAFYLLLKIDTGKNDLELARMLIDDFKVAAIPGSAFGLADNPCLRISYGMLDQTQLDAAISRLINGIRRLTM
ncbi:pyridoxal phosphate-dependent aminotransferase [Candidatus Methylomicrobium oryzae]|uniref:pyridoxal phosphate-dependent aminotransferase n=1 Tax=Candidatus Methylomicrobium oryzae TaxID=2802053 RepID=UPI0019205E24|nr:pyridoxal phosphate-dependent aminotransferase [Methylomicrobium sp. RS1]MBL1262954.1 pyridoxal phosphate-dependent aminotransferase [Methylomicrobium sp. RS1]